MEKRHVSRLRTALVAAGLLFLTAAAPDRARLVFDPAALADDCLAPASGGCSFLEPNATSGERRPSASAALIEPGAQARATKEALLLMPELQGLLNFGPEVVPIRSRPRLRAAASPAAAADCFSRARHRPDRPGCTKAVRRKLR